MSTDHSHQKTCRIKVNPKAEKPGGKSTSGKKPSKASKASFRRGKKAKKVKHSHEHAEPSASPAVKPAAEPAAEPASDAEPPANPPEPVHAFVRPGDEVNGGLRGLDPPGDSGNEVLSWVIHFG